jgi:hypothetical protein
MYLDVSLESAPSPPVLRDVENFRTFKVVVRGAGRDLASALHGLGRVDDSRDVFLDLSAVKALAGERARDSCWLESFEAMVDYARTKGWVDESGTALRAHCERAP